MTSPLDYSKKASRDYSLDWIAGLLTLVVIVQHIDDLTDYSFGWKKMEGGKIFYFYMAWFFFKSGTFQKMRSVKESYKKTWSHLVVPYLFFSILSWLLWAPGYFESHNNSWHWLMGATLIRFYSLGYIPDDGPLWFMAALIVCHFIYPLLNQSKANNYIIAVCAWIAASLYYVIWHSLEDCPYIFLPLPQGLMALSLYSLGAQWHDVKWSGWCIAVSALLYFTVLWFDPPLTQLYLAGLNTPGISWLISMPLWLGGIILCNSVIKRMPDWFFKVIDLGYIGRHSMTYYCGHFIILTSLVYLYDKGSSLFGLPLVWAMVVSCVVILPVADILLRRYLPWAVGVKGRVRKGVEVGAATDPLP